MTIEIEYFDDIGKLQADPRASAALAQATTPFERPEWWQLLAEECGLKPLIVLASDADGAMVWPLARSGRGVTALANFYNFRAPVLFSNPARQKSFLLAAVDDLSRTTSQIELTPLDFNLMAILNRALNIQNWKVVHRPGSSSQTLEAKRRSYDEYLAERPGRLRTTLKRKTRKVETEIHREWSDEAWQSYRRIYENSWKPEEASFAFWERFGRQEAAAGRLRLGIASVSSEPVAAQFWTVEHGTAFIHKLAHIEGSEKLSPGTVLTAALLRMVLDDDRVATVDYGLGDETYKRAWMERRNIAAHIVAVRPADPRNWGLLAKEAIKRLRHRLVARKKPRYASLAELKRSRMASTQHSQVVEDAENPVDARLRAVLVDILGLDAERVAEFDGDTGLFGHLPELDSQAVATLLTEIEDRFDIIIDDEDVDGEMLETYGGLRDFVRAKCDAAA